ncbi:hypothetical protein HN011_006030 [Eciton burchellii]|nr:hypothetical protein HN011_006030 [Eciton burchellii]
MHTIMLKSHFIINIPKFIKRSIGTNVPASQKATDLIQQLFLDKLREYKAKSGNEKLVDANKEILAERQSELDKLAVQFGGDKGVDMSQFPQIKFTDPSIDTGAEKK